MTAIRSVKYILSRIGLLSAADRARYYIHYWIKTGIRRKFRSENPDVRLPPDYMIYESFKLDYNKYYFGGQETARWVIDHFSNHIPLDHAVLLDWGCGPSRVLRHLPGILHKSCRVFGTDYNPDTIRWNLENIPGVHFSVNHIEPPLPYPDRHFDGVYGISVFTHLSEKLHYQWFAELVRITRPGGIILLTLQGKAFTGLLTSAEKYDFEQGRLVVRGQAKIGHRTFSAFHPEEFVRKLTKGHEVVGFEKGGITHDQPVQDVWMIRV